MRRNEDVRAVAADGQEAVGGLVGQEPATRRNGSLLAVGRDRVLRAGDPALAIPAVPAAQGAEGGARLVAGKGGDEIGDGGTLIEADVGRADRLAKRVIDVGVSRQRERRS